MQNQAISLRHKSRESGGKYQQINSSNYRASPGTDQVSRRGSQPILLIEKSAN